MIPRFTALPEGEDAGDAEGLALLEICIACFLGVGRAAGSSPFLRAFRSLLNDEVSCEKPNLALKFSHTK